MRRKAAARRGLARDPSRFWNAHASDELTANQRAMLNRLFDGFKGNLTSSKWAKICKVSQNTASREINALVAKGILRREGQGRSTHYALREECCQCGSVANGQYQLPMRLAAKNAKGAKKGNYDEEDDDDCCVVHGGKRMYWI